jgi:hypothetical protein
VHQNAWRIETQAWATPGDGRSGEALPAARRAGGRRGGCGEWRQIMKIGIGKRRRRRNWLAKKGAPLLCWRQKEEGIKSKTLFIVLTESRNCG